MVFEVFKSFVVTYRCHDIFNRKDMEENVCRVCAIASGFDMICTWGKQNKKLVEFFSRWVYWRSVLRKLSSHLLTLEFIGHNQV